MASKAGQRGERTVSAWAPPRTRASVGQVSILVPIVVRVPFVCPECETPIRLGSVTDTAPSAEALAEPVVLRCAACGGNLPFDATARGVECLHCEAANALPAAPPARQPPASRFSLVFDIRRLVPRAR